LLSEFARKYISSEIVDISGSLNLNVSQNTLDILINKPKIRLFDEKTISKYDKINIHGEYDLSKNNLKIENFSILSNELDVNVFGDVKNPFSKNPKCDLTTVVKDTQMNNFLYFLPDNLIFWREKGIPTLKKSNFYAILNGKLEIKNSPNDFQGEITAIDVHIPGFPKPYKRNDVTLTFNGDKMNVYTQVFAPDGQNVVIKGFSKLDESLYGEYTAKTTPKVDLNFARMYLVPIQQIIGFNLGPVPIMTISGYGNVDIKASGTIFDPHVWGTFNAYNASVIIEGVDAKLNSGSCKLVFEDQELLIKEVLANMEGAYFFLVGRSNVSGDVDLNIKISNAKFANILRTFNNSILTTPYTVFTKEISAVAGNVGAIIDLKGKVSDFETPEFLKSLSPSGYIEFKGNKIVLNNGLYAQKLLGVLNFGAKQSGIFEFFVGKSKFNLEYSSSDTLTKIASGNPFAVDFSLNSNKIEFQDILTKNFKMPSSVNFYTKLDLKGNLKTSLKNIYDCKLASLSGYIAGMNSADFENVKFNSGLIKFEGTKLLFDNFEMKLFDSNLKLKGNITNFLSKRPELNFSCLVDNFDLENLQTFLPKLKLTNVVLKKGEFNFKKDTINLNSLDINSENISMNLSAKIDDIYDKFQINSQFKGILNETTADLIINPHLVYPLKVKGDVPIRGSFIGNLKNYLVDFKANLPKDTDISWSGANIGDVDFERDIIGKINVEGNVAHLNNLRLIKHVQGQNKIIAQTELALNGKIKQIQNNIFYDNFKIITYHPINVRILNLIFKKSLLKNGDFECNLNVSGNVQYPNVTGKIKLGHLDIPLYSTQIQNIKITLYPNVLYSEVIAKNRKSDIRAYLQAKNSLIPPYVIEKISFSSDKINVEDLLESMPKTKAKSDIAVNRDFNFKPDDLIIKNGDFDFKEVNFSKNNIQNLKGKFRYNKNVFDLQNILFELAGGLVEASGKFSLLTTDLFLKASVKGADSNVLAGGFLNMQKQIFGKMDGAIELTAKHLDTPQGIKSVKADVNFEIKEGKMPKLGSLEYLLRAGNAVKSGILGLSINNIANILTPYKTGEFETIQGSFKIEDAKLKNLEIASKGKNMSLYLAGEYDILETFADIGIYGRLSQSVSNALDSITNASIKQLFNSLGRNKHSKKENDYTQYFEKVPLTTTKVKSPVYFRAKVLGDINKDNYIKEFAWE
ncbi:hypothetical protein IJ670_02965, partial [bacterium]|nr:hypothetical protein [bacterium]